MGRERDESGRFSQEVSPEDVLAVFGGHEPYTTREIAESLEIPKRTAYEKLRGLVDDGSLARKDIGGLATVWYRPAESE